MSGNNSIAEVLRVMRSAGSDAPEALLQSGAQVQTGAPRAQNARPDPKTLAFQIEMRMAQQAMRAMNGGEEQNAQSSGLDSSMFGDAMLMDALATMARLTGQEQAALKPALPEGLDRALTRNPSAQGLGSVAALFESGDKGAAAIGYDRTGGTSYGKFQISSKAGTMGRFLNYLDEREPSWAARLRSAGPANTGSAQGRMPAEWARIAAEHPERFERLQTEFIKKDHYQPAREKILEQTGVDIESARPALREALFSTAVQHGASGAARIFNQAIDKFLGKGGQPAGPAASAKGFEQALVSEVYDKRQHQFGGSTEAVRSSVRSRLRQEKDLVLAMLEKKGLNRVV